MNLSKVEVKSCGYLNYVFLMVDTVCFERFHSLNVNNLRAIKIKKCNIIISRKGVQILSLNNIKYLFIQPVHKDIYYTCIMRIAKCVRICSLKATTVG